MNKKHSKILTIQNIIIAALVLAVALLFYLLFIFEASTQSSEDSLAQEIFQLRTK